MDFYSIKLSFSVLKLLLYLMFFHIQVREKKLEEILKTPLRVLPTVGVASSSETLEGVLPLINELEHLAIDTSLFPHAQVREREIGIEKER